MRTSQKKGKDNTYIDELPVPEVEEEEEELEERAASTWNVAVWESLVLTSPMGEAWKLYPGLHEVSAEFRLIGNTTRLQLTPVGRQEESK